MKKRLVVNPDIILKLINLEDVSVMFKTVNTHRPYLGEYLSWADLTTHSEHIRDFIESCMRDADKGLGYTYAILYKDVFVGTVAYIHIDKLNCKTEIGYWLAEDYQKKGIMLQCIEFLTPYILCEQNLNRITIRCAKSNLKSRAIPERLGYTLEGIERDGFKQRDGTYLDMCIYSKIKKDLEEQ